MLKLTCGIVLYNTPDDDLHRLMNSIAAAGKMAGLSPTIHVIDNSANVVKPFNVTDCSLKIFPHQGNIGFGRAHNILMADAFAAASDAYLAVNPDGFAHPNMLAAMLSIATGANAPMLLEARQFPQEHPKPYDPVTLETPWCSGACLMVPRTLGLQLGGFDDGFFMYCEDVDLSWRARLSGARCLVAPDAYFFHDVAGRGESQFANWHMALSMNRLLAKWGSRPPVGLRRLLDRMLQDIPESERIRGSVATVAPLHLRSGFSPVDFDHYFGFSDMRWS